MIRLPGLFEGVSDSFVWLPFPLHGVTPFTSFHRWSQCKPHPSVFFSPRSSTFWRIHKPTQLFLCSCLNRRLWPTFKKKKSILGQMHHTTHFRNSPCPNKRWTIRSILGLLVLQPLARSRHGHVWTWVPCQISNNYVDFSPSPDAWLMKLKCSSLQDHTTHSDSLQ